MSVARSDQHFDERDHRLPRLALPRRYALEFSPDIAAATFSGSQRVELDVVEATRELVLNSAELEIHSAVLRRGPGGEGDEVPLEVVFEPGLERVRLRSGAELATGPWLLECKFSGILNDKLRGFYRSTFTDEAGEPHVIATTQFQSIDARRAFPCWDEPEFKAVFSVTLDVEDHLLAISNSAEVASCDLGGGRRRVRFADTMKMSTYLLAFVIGPLEATAPVDVDGVPLRVVYPPGKGQLTSFALECGAHALRFFAEFFAQPYPGDKLDLVAIPDFAAGAMENVGCVTFREVALLTDPERSSRNELEYIASVVEHEIAHMWFGDLVTMRWWNGVWLNEAFATYMSMACLDDFKPDYQCWVSFGRDRDVALSLDGLHTTRPIEFPVLRPKDAEAMFDPLTYEKGGSVLRMVELYLGRERFRAGVRRYLAEHLWGNTETTDLWDAIEAEAPDQPIRALMDSWILQGGHPLVTASAHGDGATLTQAPFAYLPEDARPPDSAPSEIGSSWLVPVATERRPNGTRHYDLLGSEPVAVAGGEGLLVVNAGGAGVFRLRYEGPLLDRVIEDLDRLESLERFTLAADLWACALAGKVAVDQFLALTRRLQGETDPSVWSVVTNALGLFDVAVADEDRGELQRFTCSLLGPELDAMGWDPVPGEDGDAPRRRGLFVGALGLVGDDPAVRSEALRRFRAVDQGEPLAADLAMSVLQVVAATAGREEFDTILYRYRHPADPLEEQRYLDSLGSLRDLDLAGRVCEMCATEIRSQDAPFLVRLLMVNRVTGRLTWEFMTSRWDELVERYPANTISRMLSGVTRLVYLDADGRPLLFDEVVKFCRAHPLPGDQRPVEQHLERLAMLVRFVQRQRPQLAASLAKA